MSHYWYIQEQAPPYRLWAEVAHDWASDQGTATAYDDEAKSTELLPLGGEWRRMERD